MPKIPSRALNSREEFFTLENKLKITDHIEQNSIRVIMITICTIEYMSKTSRIITTKIIESNVAIALIMA